MLKCFSLLFGFTNRRYQISCMHLLLAAFIITSVSCTQVPPYQDTSLSFEERAADLVSRMTLEEKVAQMLHEAPAIERLNIPAYNWWNECLHGVGRAGLATVFPQAIGMAAMWDDELMFRIASAISDEARAKHQDFASRNQRGIYQGLTFWTPNINIFRDPRWGRGMETYGEDPFLAGSLAVPFIKGLQGDDPRYLKLVATAKHFVVHSGPESDRHRFNVHPSQRDFYETYIPHFKRAVQEAEVYSVMCAYNRLFDEPCCGSKYVEDLLRIDWGFKGYIVSDCWAIVDFYNKGDHEVVQTVEEAAAMAVKAGTDLNCGESYVALVEAVRQGLVTEKEIDKCVTRLMLARMKLGMFDPQEDVPYTSIPISVVNSEVHQKLALESARKSMVLLQNKNQLLPLSKQLKRVAVIGPNAHNPDVLLANYNGYPERIVTPYMGIAEKLPNVDVMYAQGSRHADEFPYMSVVPANVLFADSLLKSNGLNVAYFDNTNFDGKPVYVGIDNVIDFAWWDKSPAPGVSNNLFSARWSGFLVPERSGSYRIGGNGFSGYALRLDGELLVDRVCIHHPHMTYKEMWLEAGRKYKIVFECVQNQSTYPMARLLWDAPGQNLKQEALQLAAKSDAVVLCLGLSPELEGEEMFVEIPGFLGGDRTEIYLPATQSELVKAVLALGKPVVVVLINGSALALDNDVLGASAILEAWYPGQAGGTAIADILFGDYNPAGRLPVTFYKSASQLPPFDDYSMEGRTYKYFRGEPLFPFGFGLSYTTFTYSNLQVASQIMADEPVNVSVEVTNTGKMAGDEVVQLYVSFPGRENAPIRTLQGFRRIHLKAGETATVSFTLKPDQLALYHEKHGRVVYSGDISLTVGGQQPNEAALKNGTVLTQNVKVNGEFICR